MGFKAIHKKRIMDTKMDYEIRNQAFFVTLLLALRTHFDNYLY